MNTTQLVTLSKEIMTKCLKIFSENNNTAQNSVHNNSGTVIGSKSSNINAGFQSFKVDNDAAVKVKKAKKASGNEKQSSKKGRSATIPVLPILTSSN